MAEGGFDDIEMKNRNMEEEETSFGGDDLQTASGHNRSINIINSENPIRKTRVDLSRETPLDIIRMKNAKSTITNDKKFIFKKNIKNSS